MAIPDKKKEPYCKFCGEDLTEKDGKIIGHAHACPIIKGANISKHGTIGMFKATNNESMNFEYRRRSMIIGKMIIGNLMPKDKKVVSRMAYESVLFNLNLINLNLIQLSSELSKIHKLDSIKREHIENDMKELEKLKDTELKFASGHFVTSEMMKTLYKKRNDWEMTIKKG